MIETDTTPSLAEFLSGVAKHKMTVRMESGIYRHLWFAEPGTGNRHFALTTWPGYLAITGDMGAFTFTRVEDMFEFFRAKPSHGLAINPGYWAEKAVAVDRNGGLTKFSPEKARNVVTDGAAEGWEPPVDMKRVESEVFSELDSGEHAFRTALQNFEDYTGTRVRFPFSDHCEWNFHEYDFHFIWCLYAIVWGIQQYDRAASATQGDREGAKGAGT